MSTNAVNEVERNGIGRDLSGAAGKESEPNRWWQIADLGVFGAWIALVATILGRHEPWADEAQAWLLARDLNLKTLWFHELRYEGTPGLWHTTLWAAQHIFHLSYSSLGLIGVGFATAGVALMLFNAPFPRPIRYLLAFSYYMVYQYAVIARPYTMFPLLAFAAAIAFKDRLHPERITIVLILLANVNAHGALLAACIGLAYLIEVIHAWSGLNAHVRRRYVISTIAMLVTFFLLFLVLKPPPDVEALQQQRTFVVMTEKAWQGIEGAFFDSSPLALLWLALAGAWCWQRKKLTVYIVPIIMLAVLYGVVDGWAHQQGTILIASITALWIAWPTPQERAGFLSRENNAYYAVVVLMVCLLGNETWNAAAIIRNDYLFPYCGAKDAAKYLKSVGADQKPIVGYLYAMVAVQAYFDRNILSNVPTAYAHHGLPLEGVRLDRAELVRRSPDYVVLPCWENCESTFSNVYEPYMRMGGYSLAHVSNGTLFWKQGWSLQQIYFIYRRD